MRTELLALTIVASQGLSCAADTSTRRAEGGTAELSADELRERIARYATPELSADISLLPESERQALSAIVAAARYLDPVFERQVWAGNPQLLERLEAQRGELALQQLRYLRLMRGPWDQQDSRAPVLVKAPHPAGAGFYPEDMSAEEFHRWIAAHPEDKESFESLFTIIRRDEASGLVAVPYRDAYREWLAPAAEGLRQAADLTKNASLAKFLRSRAEALGSDDYYQSDKDWMDLDSQVEVVFGPYETYEDGLLGLKATYEAFVTVSDPAASAALQRFKGYLPEMEQHLPIPDAMKTARGAESPIRVVDLVFTSGDARGSVQTIAFNLPNDERVRQEKGAKKVMLRNAIRTKFEQILQPLAAQILAPEQVSLLSAEAFFHETLFHEMSHSLGPAYSRVNGEAIEVRLALGPSDTAIEECKADSMGAYNVLYLIEKGEFPPSFREPLLVTYFAGLFRSMRFGVDEAHGQGAAVQANRYLEAGAATWDPAAGRFTVHPDLLEREIARLVTDLCVLQHEGDKAAADALLTKYGRATPVIQAALARTRQVPVDIRPLFPLAGERGDPLAISLRP